MHCTDIAVCSHRIYHLDKRWVKRDKREGDIRGTEGWCGLHLVTLRSVAELRIGFLLNPDLNQSVSPQGEDRGHLVWLSHQKLCRRKPKQTFLLVSHISLLTETSILATAKVHKVDRLTRYFLGLVSQKMCECSKILFFSVGIIILLTFVCCL